MGLETDKAIRELAVREGLKKLNREPYDCVLVDPMDCSFDPGPLPTNIASLSKTRST